MFKNALSDLLLAAKWHFVLVRLMSWHNTTRQWSLYYVYTAKGLNSVESLHKLGAFFFYYFMYFLTNNQIFFHTSKTYNIDFGYSLQEVIPKKTSPILHAFPYRNDKYPAPVIDMPGCCFPKLQQGTFAQIKYHSCRLRPVIHAQCCTNHTNCRIRSAC